LRAFSGTGFNAFDLGVEANKGWEAEDWEDKDDNVRESEDNGLELETSNVALSSGNTSSSVDFCDIGPGSSSSHSLMMSEVVRN
jgi:hypothetical protein